MTRALALVFLSGAAALIYELVWFQQLELILGSTAVSLAMLLAVFMGGTCLGSLAAPRLALSNSWRNYAAAELAIAVCAALAMAAMPAAAEWYWRSEGNPALRGVIAVLCLLPPTFAMGLTLPLAARLIPSDCFGWLYAANIAGGVVGCLAAGFWLLRIYDTLTAAAVAVAVNTIVAAVAFASRGLALHPPDRAADAANDDPADTHSADARVLFAIAISGFCALAAEALWTRMLGLLLGASVYTFSLILATFLLGLGLGSAVSRRLIRTQTAPAALAFTQLLAAAGIAWGSRAIALWLPFLRSEPSLDAWRQFPADLGLAAFAVFPAALAWGASFPIAVAALRKGNAVVRTYAANTVGAIAGALITSLWLVTWLGTQHTAQVMVLAAALGCFVLIANRREALMAAVVTLVALRSVAPVPPLLIAHGRFASSWKDKSEILYAAEGRNSPVAVSRFEDGTVTFHVAGKVQASSIARDMRLQRMLGHLTTHATSAPKSVLVIGCGAGVTAGAVANDPLVERVTIAEIEPLVPAASAKYFGEFNGGVLDNPKVRVHFDDGRHFLLTTRERFDAITIDPLDPWVKGAASLYTREFYQAMRARLNPGGVATMYIQLFETTPEAVRTALATFAEVFPDATIWGNPWERDGKRYGHDVVLLGTNGGGANINLDILEQRFPAIEESLGEVGMYSMTDLFGTYAGRVADMREWLAGATINTDRNLRMQYQAGLGLNRDDADAIYRKMLAYRRWPEGMFRGAPMRVASVKLATQ